MKRVLFATAFAFLVAVSTPVQAADHHEKAEELLPPNAKPGECYARVFVPPQYSTETRTVLRRAAYTRQQISPAQFEWAEQRVLVKEATERIEVVPATYRRTEERILVKSASKKVVQVPATFEPVTEQVLDRPAHTVWKKGKGPISKVDNATGEIMCLVEVPATYKTVTKRVLKSPATTREVEIPGAYKTVRKQVIADPPTIRKVAIPAVYDTVRVHNMVEPPRVNTIEIPAEHQTVTNTVRTSDGHMEWQPILCETNMTKAMIRDVQRALGSAGHYSGPIDGIVGKGTVNGMQAFQRSKGLPEGQFTLESLRALGLRPGS